MGVTNLAKTGVNRPLRSTTLSILFCTYQLYPNQFNSSDSSSTYPANNKQCWKSSICCNRCHIHVGGDQLYSNWSARCENSVCADELYSSWSVLCENVMGGHIHLEEFGSWVLAHSLRELCRPLLQLFSRVKRNTMSSSLENASGYTTCGKPANDTQLCLFVHSYLILPGTMSYSWSSIFQMLVTNHFRLSTKL
jgi:hypothetical protein